MAAIIVKAKLRSTQSSESNAQEDCLALFCDNSYPLGGYPLAITQYFAGFDFVLPTFAVNGPFNGYYDSVNQKWVICRDSSEIPNGTNLTFTASDGSTAQITFFIIARNIPGIRPPVQEPTAPIGTLGGGAFVAKTGDTVTGTVVVSATGGITANSGSVTTIAGVMSETPTQITGATIPLVSKRYWVSSAVPEINAVSGTIPDGAIISIFSTDGGTVLKNNSTFLNSGSVDFTFRANDSINWQYDLGVGKFIQCTSPQFDGTNITYVGGYVKNEGTEVIAEPTEITMDNQPMYGTGNWKVGATTPAELTKFAPPPGNVNATFTMTVEDAVRLINANAGVSVPTVNGQIVLNGYSFIDPIFGDTVYFRYDPNFNNSGVGAWVVNEVYFRH
jgi:hypothetical protein